MSKRTRRKLSQLRRQSGTVLESDVDQFGQRVLFYDGIPVLVDDFVPDNETLGTGTGLSSIYAVKWGPSGLMGLENGGIVVEEVGALETKNARRWRVRWYCGLASSRRWRSPGCRGSRPTSRATGLGIGERGAPDRQRAPPRRRSPCLLATASGQRGRARRWGSSRPVAGGRAGVQRERRVFIADCPFEGVSRSVEPARSSGR
jgi:hypothetical protein